MHCQQARHEAKLAPIVGAEVNSERAGSHDPAELVVWLCVAIPAVPALHLGASLLIELIRFCTSQPGLVGWSVDVALP